MSPTPRNAMLIAAAMAAVASVPLGSGPMTGGPATPEERERRRQSKLARAPKLTAKAEAKRRRKAERRLAALSRRPEQEAAQ